MIDAQSDPPASEDAAALGSDRRYGPVEMLEGALYVLGGRIELDGSVSWAPEARGRFQPVNTYLLTGDEPLIVDPGLSCVRGSVTDGLQGLLPSDAEPSVFITRSQLDCVGNLGAVCTAYPVEEIFTGGLYNPFDSFDAATSVDAKAAIRPAVERSPDESRLEIYNTPLRLLATFWGYDPATRVLFTSDSFTHATLADRDSTPVVRSLDEDSTTAADVRAHLHSTFWWLQHAQTQTIVSGLREFFDTHPVEVIAPDRGCVLAGEDVVAHHVDMVLSALSDTDRGS